MRRKADRELTIIPLKKNIIRIGVISDTHVPLCCPALPRPLLEGLKGVDLILHAGDFITPDTLKALEEIAPVYAVSGNMDNYHIKQNLPLKREIKISRFKIGIIHGYGQPADLPLRMRKEFKAVDVIIFGHSHKPFKQIIDGVLMFNPGSPTDKIFTNSNSFGILELDSKIKAEHIEI